MPTRKFFPATRVLSLAFYLLVIASCRKNNNPGNPTGPVQWQAYTPISTNVGLMNGRYQNNRLNIWGSVAFYSNLPSTYTGPAQIFNTGNFSGSGRLRFPVTDRFFVFTDNHSLVFRSALTTAGNSVERTLDLAQLDPDFYSLIDVPYWQGECLGINSANQVLVPYQAVHNGVAIPTPYFALIQLIPPQTNDNDIQFGTVQLIRQNLVAGQVTVYRVTSIGTQFFVVMGNGTYRVDSNGNISRVADVALNIYQLGATLYGFARNLSTDEADYYRSTDSGQSWQRLGGIAVGVLADLQYTVINDRVIGFTGSQLFEFETSGNSFSVRELKNDGLSLADITSLSLLNKDTVFLTSHANTFTSICGGYFKPLKNLFDLQKQ